LLLIFALYTVQSHRQ